MRPIRLSRLLTLSGYFGLLGLLLAWNVWLAPSLYFPTALVLIVLLLPLLIPLRGLLHGRAYTHQWSSFLALWYLVLGISEAYASPGQRLLGLLETLFSAMFFFGAVWYARLNRPEKPTEP